MHYEVIIKMDEVLASHTLNTVLPAYLDPR